MKSAVFDAFHPLIRDWFARSVGCPTDIQQKAWPEIAAGRHVLAVAPTGSGKTLAAFLWAIHQLATGAWEGGRVRVLYVSPLKALNNDVHRNLLAPLAELQEAFEAAGEAFPPIRVLTRSGDTPQDERRRMVRRPPEILITTPESLNLILGAKQARQMLTGVAAVILDEIHAAAGTKRGTHLITAVDRLVRLSGEFQRIALSATVRPMETMAAFVGGFRMTGDPRDPAYDARPVILIRSEMEKSMEIRVVRPDMQETDDPASVWPALVQSFKEIIRAGRSTLFFTNSRRTAEKVARLLNADEPEDIAYSHHGSLSKEIRLAVEANFKAGGLKAIVATHSLELGIDIGDLDRVVLIQTPGSTASALQRIGRSGHRAGETSRGLLFPTHGRDFLNAAVMARCVMEQDIEAVRPAENPLDVLAQVILSMTAAEPWDMDALFAFFRASYPFRNLTRRQFDLALDMLAGRYADARIRELKPRLSVDRIDNTATARSGSLWLVSTSGGTIPDWGYFVLRRQDNRAAIGELDEEFVWERKQGEAFALGAQTWRIQRITHSEVEVVPVSSAPGIIPFWRAEALHRDFHLSEKTGLFLEQADAALPKKADGFKAVLRRDYCMDDAAAEALTEFLVRQKEATGGVLPHRRHLLVEHANDPMNTSGTRQMILHTLWGGRVNRPFALALGAACEEAAGAAPEVFAQDDCILLRLPRPLAAADLLALVSSENLEGRLRTCLENTGFFGARFRENAGRALLLPRAGIHRRMPLWMNRLRAKKLMEAVKGFPDFPILLETWRTCFQDEFDLENLKLLLDEVRSGAVRVSEVFTQSASPFAKSLVWEQTNQYIYQDDTPDGKGASGLSDDLICEVIQSARLRPRIPDALITALGEKLSRTAPGYAPHSSVELLDWVKERLLIPEDEWEDLMAAIRKDHGIDPADLLRPNMGKIFRVRLPGAGLWGVCALETLGRMAGAFPGAVDRWKFASVSDAAQFPPEKVRALIRKEINRQGDEPDGGAADERLAGFMAQWLSFYGPIPATRMTAAFGMDERAAAGVSEALVREGAVVVDAFREASDVVEICDRTNLEILLRMARSARKPGLAPLPAEALPLFLAFWQGLTAPGDGIGDLQERLEQLFGFPAPAGAWESDILPARLAPFFGAWLDSLMQTSDLCWFGCGREKLAFAFAGDLDLFRESNPVSSEPDAVPDIMPDARGKYGFFELSSFSGLATADLTRKLWSLAWEGKIANDTFDAVRKGLLNRFEPEQAAPRTGRGRRGRFNRWKSSRPLAGNWHVLDPDPFEPDLLEIQEIQKDRVRQLLSRYGVLFRELTDRDPPALKWRDLFRTLRLMELSGEIMSGHFFEGVSGVQFISPEALRVLSDQAFDADAVFWINAADPASPCGLGLAGLPYDLPPRVPSAHLVFHGRRLVLISRGNGRRLEIHAEPDAPDLPAYLSFFRVLLSREFNPLRRIQVETVNGEPAVKSPFAGALVAFGFSRGYKWLELRRTVF